ncbi:RHS repeat-associated core domain-containing protein [uncultured Kordia sp.]|uniref:RHS repeat-associated core domain-containing protein n=1 Tax=uncultured Kordia sp. TaxID=507699 RepID=UPI0026141309|nr:RHS repeat-associated core domain-containing protein [uncultured Kordia sp.]
MSPFGLKHKGYNNQITGRDHNYGYNGIEESAELGLNVLEMDMRQYDPAIARWIVIDPVTHFDYSPYQAFDNNPIYWADPSGADAVDFATDLFNRSQNGTTWTNNNDGTFSDGNGNSVDCNECGVQFYEIAKYKGTLPNYDYSVASEEFKVGDFNVVPYYKGNTIVGYGASRDGRLEYVLDAGSIGWFRNNTFLTKTLADSFYVNGTPDQSTIAMASGDVWKGLKSKWGKALSSPEYYLYVATLWAGGTRSAPAKSAARNTTRSVSPYSLEATQSITISRRQFQLLVNDIKTNGIRVPVEYSVNNGVNYIVDGHHRVYIAKRLGIDVPVREVQFQPGHAIIEPGKNPGYLKHIKY